ncbi:tetratricopeptide repeat protein [Nostoc sp. DedSLP04]|uniref:tetratricopeptide repeat protein n=1 Tax=Nostoc sp. DedSLP04 TaxID=3075401 RepID=UPI002AD29897|nr:tetratricopeptide repeat protein [Nostoc sp. DedSLP04]MDZ8034095.1 tetratricopeptide repeat protein [Nostoc sp. DedSLP04]
MEWADFLANEATERNLSSAQREAFVERLKDENSNKKELNLAIELGIEEDTFTKRMNAVYKKFAKSYPELATLKGRGKLEKLRACLTAKYNGGQDAQPTIKEIHHNIPPAVPFEKFVGRETELEELHSSLQTSRQVAIVAVAAMGGVGKTELATQYAKQHLQNYQGGVCWLSAQGIDVGIQILRFAELKFKLIAPDDWELADRLRYCWQNWEKGEVLLVFDDVTDYKKQVQPYLPPESPRFKVLLTTRLGFDRTLPQLPLGVLKPLAAMKLLKSLVDRERLKSEPWVARRICKFLGYLPLALELVGRYLDTMPDLSLEILLKRLEKKRLEHEAVARANPLMRYEYGVAEAFALSWEHLDENAQSLGCWLSLYALADIPFSVETIEDDDKQELWEKAIAELRKLHLIQWQSKGIYRLHPLIRLFFQMKLDESSNAIEVKIAFVAQMVEVAKQIPQQLNREDIFNFTSHIPHLAEVATHLSEYLSDGDLIRPFTGLGWFYQGQGLYQQAEPWLRQCVKIAENRLGSEHLDIATSLNNLAALHKSTGRYSEAEPLYKQALELTKCLLGNNHPIVATSLNNLAELYRYTGRYSEAEPLYLQALEMRQRLLGEKHPDVANSLNNLALLYGSTRRYSEAEPLFQQALELKKHLLGNNHLDIAINLNNLAALYKSTGRYSEAEPLFQQALELRQRLLGDNHPDVANSLNNLASLYCSTGRFNEGEPLYQQALELYKRLLGDNHPDVAISLNNLAGLYCSTGRFNEGEPLFQQALAICEQTLGVGHPDTIAVRGNYAKFLRET